MKPSFSQHTELVKSVADPHDHKPHRLPTFPDIERTSILPLIATTQTTVASGGTAIAFAARCPAAPLWMYNTFPNFSGLQNITVSQGGPLNLTMPVLSGESLSISSLLVGRPVIATTNWSPLWSGIVVDSGGEYWFWVPSGLYVSLVCTLSGTPTGGTSYSEWEYTSSFSTADTTRFGASVTYSGGFAYSSPVDFGGGFVRPLSVHCNLSWTGTANVTDIGVRVGTSSVSPLVVQPAITLNCVAPVWATPPEFAVAPFIYGGCRLNAMSALFQNTTAVLSKEGSVEGMLLSSGSANPQLLSSGFDYTSYAADVAASCRYQGLLEKGLYTFTLPDSKTTKFVDAFQRGRTGGSYPLITLDSFDYINVVRFTDYSSPATNLFITVDVHLEFRNTSMLWPIGVSTVELEAWHKSQVTLQSMTPFFENPVHLTAIANLARAAAIRLYPIARPIIASALSAGRDKLISMAANAIHGSISKPQIALREPRKPAPKKPKPRAKVAVVVQRRRR